MPGTRLGIQQELLDIDKVLRDRRAKRHVMQIRCRGHCDSIDSEGFVPQLLRAAISPAARGLGRLRLRCAHERAQELSIDLVGNGRDIEPGLG